MGARAGVWWSDRWRIDGRCRSLAPSGRKRGEWAGVASGVWSGVGERESCEKVGEEGAVELGELGLERLTRCEWASSSSFEWERVMLCEMAYAESDGRRPPL